MDEPHYLQQLSMHGLAWLDNFHSNLSRALVQYCRLCSSWQLACLMFKPCSICVILIQLPPNQVHLGSFYTPSHVYIAISMVTSKVQGPWGFFFILNQIIRAKLLNKCIIFQEENEEGDVSPCWVCGLVLIRFDRMDLLGLAKGQFQDQGYFGNCT